MTSLLLHFLLFCCLLRDVLQLRGENLCSIARISMGMVSPLPLLPCLDGSTPLVSPASRGPLHYHAAVKLKEGEGGIESMPERTDTDGWMADRTRGEKLLMDLREGIPEDSDLFTERRGVMFDQKTYQKGWATLVLA